MKKLIYLLPITIIPIALASCSATTVKESPTDSTPSTEEWIIKTVDESNLEYNKNFGSFNLETISSNALLTINLKDIKKSSNIDSNENVFTPLNILNLSSDFKNEITEDLSQRFWYDSVLNFGIKQSDISIKHSRSIDKILPNDYDEFHMRFVYSYWQFNSGFFDMEFSDDQIVNFNSFQEYKNYMKREPLIKLSLPILKIDEHIPYNDINSNLCYSIFNKSVYIKKIEVQFVKPAIYLGTYEENMAKRHKEILISQNNNTNFSDNYYSKISDQLTFESLLRISFGDNKKLIKEYQEKYNEEFFKNNMLIFIPNHISKIDNNKKWVPTNLNIQKGYSNLEFEQQEISEDEKAELSKTGYDSIASNYLISVEKNDKYFYGQINYFF